MAFRDNYDLREDGIYVLRGRFRETDWWEPCFQANPTTANVVYKLMEVVYNEGEHDGRKFVRRAVKEALDIEL